VKLGWEGTMNFCLARPIPSRGKSTLPVAVVVLLFASLTWSGGAHMAPAIGGGLGNEKYSPPANPLTAWVLTPNGEMPRSCVHEIPNNSTVITDGYVSPGGQPTHFSKCNPKPPSSHPDGSDYPCSSGCWIEDAWTYWKSQPTIGGMWAEWEVPGANPPASVNGSNYGMEPVIYFFDSLEPCNETAGQNCLIIQPVLGWGYDGLVAGDGSGLYWWISSFVYYSTGAAAYTFPIPVNLGDVIAGNMTAGPPQNSACSGGSCSWAIITDDLTTGSKVELSCKGGNTYESYDGGSASGLCDMQSMTWAGVVLEAYDIGSCNYPDPSVGTTQFEASILTTSHNAVKTYWVPDRIISGCDAGVALTGSGGTVGTISLDYGCAQWCEDY